MGYCGNWVLNFAWDLVVIFLGIPNWWLTGLKFFFLIFGLKGITEICVVCFLVYLLFFGGGAGVIRKMEKVCVCVCVCMRNVIKTAMLPHFNIYVGVYVKKGSWVATKHTTVKIFLKDQLTKFQKLQSFIFLFALLQEILLVKIGSSLVTLAERNISRSHRNPCNELFL